MITLTRIAGCIVLMSVAFAFLFGGLGYSPSVFIDGTQIFTVGLGTVGIILVGTQRGDFLTAVRVCLTASAYQDGNQRQIARRFFLLAARSARASGLLNGIAGAIIMTGQITFTQYSPLGSVISVCLLSLLYGFILAELVFQPFASAVAETDQPL